MSESRFIYCEGCGARLNQQDRSCPKCGHPAPDILSASNAASDLAAGRTASFPRLSHEDINLAVPQPASHTSAIKDANDPDATGVLQADALASVSMNSARRNRDSNVSHASRVASAYDAHEPTPNEHSELKNTRLKRRVLVGGFLGFAVLLIAFAAFDPLGVMPGFYQEIDRLAAEAFPSRQISEEPNQQHVDERADNDSTSHNEAALSDNTLSDDAAYVELTEIYERILGYQGDFGSVVDDYNGYYMASSKAQREQHAASAYNMRESIEETKDELSSLKLAEDSAYEEDVEHLLQLATWMYNRVNVLCESWDISLGLPEGERPSSHQDEILKPLRDVQMVDGKAVDVLEFEKNVSKWKPQKK